MGKSKKTDEIVNEIKNNRTNYEIIKIHSDYFIKEKSIYKIIEKNLKKRNLKQSDLIKMVNLDPQNGYKYLNGKNKMNRDLLIKILIVFQMTLEEIQEILKENKFPMLYVKDKRDYIIVTAILNNCTLSKTNEMLGINNEYLL